MIYDAPQQLDFNALKKNSKFDKLLKLVNVGRHLFQDYMDNMKVTNKEVRRRLDIRGDIMQSIMRRKLSLFGHICRMDDGRTKKTVMLGSMDGGNRRGR